MVDNAIISAVLSSVVEEWKSQYDLKKKNKTIKHPLFGRFMEKPIWQFASITQRSLFIETHAFLS
jgi:hypothetical protein